MATKYERYGLPVKPADPDAEYLTVQETAWVFRCSVPTIRRRCKQLGIGRTVGARIVLNHDDRTAIAEFGRRSSTPQIPTQRRRKPAKRTAAKPATKRNLPAAA